MKAYIFPGQGSQFSGMGKDLFDQSSEARALFEQANETLGFDLTKILFEGTKEELTQTKVTQPAIYVHSVIQAQVTKIQPAMVAGHSLGEFSALASIGVFSFEEGLQLVSQRALAMQKACEITNGTMAAILGLADEEVEEICNQYKNISAANYNCPGQLVISGDKEELTEACEKLKEKGAKRALILPVSGAFHSPLMASAAEQLASAIEATPFNTPTCPIYQNVTASAVTNPEEIKTNLLAQLTGSVKWTQTINKMIEDGATNFLEVGPGNVLQGLVKKINSSVEAEKV